jgi:hypothetical protein
MKFRLPLLRLEKEDGLNTRLFNRRLSQIWCHMPWSSPGAFIFSFPQFTLPGGPRIRGYHLDHGTYNGLNQKAREGNFLFFPSVATKQHYIWDSAGFSWFYFTNSFYVPDLLLGIELCMEDPGRDTRKLRDLTVTLANTKKKVNVFIAKKDHHLFDFFKAKRRWTAKTNSYKQSETSSLTQSLNS